MKKTFLSNLTLTAGALLLSGCALFNNSISYTDEIVVTETDKPVVIDGKVTDEIWNKAPYYSFVLPCDRLRDWCSNRPVQEGMAQIAYDKNNVYILAKFIDDDIVQYGKDGDHLYSRGDLLEFFAYNTETGHYWEIYGSANAKSTVMFFENAGRRIFPEAIQKDDKIQVAAVLNGTLNNSKDTDNGYVVEMAIPMSIFNSKGDFFKPGTKWKVLCARYNYSKSFDNIEYSTTSKMKKLNYHDRDSYLPVVFK